MLNDAYHDRQDKLALLDNAKIELRRRGFVQFANGAWGLPHDSIVSFDPVELLRKVHATGADKVQLSYDRNGELIVEGVTV
jgi:hypothetical protein